MNNPFTALVTLAAAVVAIVVLSMGGNSNEPEVAPPKVDKKDTEKNDTEPETQAAPAAPQTPCNALGVPIPVVRNKSALHRPEVVEKLLSAIPNSVKDTLLQQPPASLPANIKTGSMVWIPGGTFVMGSDTGPADEVPPHAVAIDGFWMDKTEVTNAQFQDFVDSTNYVTLAEKQPELRSIQPGSALEQTAILEEFNQPGSICSLQLKSRDDIDPEKGAYSWWQYVPGADWMHPEGPDSNIKERMNHPVVHLSWIDVQEYCKWAGKSLPSEAQWEYAARAGQQGNFYPWGNQRNPDGKQLQNIWQGTFPIEDTAEDGFKTTAPVGTFPANQFGLHDMTGNVWEWCADYYQPDYYFNSPQKNPAGPNSSFDPQEPGIIKRVQRGGSFMCSDEYCIGYRVSARMKGEQDTGAFHTGFRCVITPQAMPKPNAP
ncbi:MAG: formylglycine-generating enzyme family protein [Fuerstiella sp.]